MQEIKAERLLPRRSCWNKLLGRCEYFPPSLESAPRQKENPMTKSRWSSLLALFCFVCAGLRADTLVSQEFQNEAGWPSYSNSNSLIGSSLENNTQYVSIAVIDWASARPRPSSLVHNKLLRSCLIGDTTIRSNIAPAGEGLNRPQWESSECYGRSVGRLLGIKGNGLDVSERQQSLADGQVQSFVGLAVNESEPMKVYRLGVSLPATIGNIDSGNARGRQSSGQLHQVVDDVPRCQEMPVRVDNEPASVDQIDSESTVPVLMSAYNWNDGMFHFFYGGKKGVTSLRLSMSDGDKKKKKKRPSQENTSTADEFHSSGPLVLQNDGKPIGCDVSHPTSAAIAISCPQIDAVGAHKEAPSSTKHDPSTPPPSPE